MLGLGLGLRLGIGLGLGLMLVLGLGPWLGLGLRLGLVLVLWLGLRLVLELKVLLWTKLRISVEPSSNPNPNHNSDFLVGQSSLTWTKHPRKYYPPGLCFPRVYYPTDIIYPRDILSYYTRKLVSSVQSYAAVLTVMATYVGKRRISMKAWSMTAMMTAMMTGMMTMMILTKTTLIMMAMMDMSSDYNSSECYL